MYYNHIKAHNTKNDLFAVFTIALYATGAVYVLGWDNVIAMLKALVH